MKLGLVQELEIVKITENGVYLSDPQDSVPVNAPSDSSPEDLTVQKVLLPKNQSPKNAQIGMRLTVFLYKDSEDRPIANSLISGY